MTKNISCAILESEIDITSISQSLKFLEATPKPVSAILVSKSMGTETMNMLQEKSPHLETRYIGILCKKSEAAQLRTRAYCLFESKELKFAATADDLPCLVDHTTHPLKVFTNIIMSPSLSVQVIKSTVKVLTKIHGDLTFKYNPRKHSKSYLMIDTANRTVTDVSQGLFSKEMLCISEAANEMVD